MRCGFSLCSDEREQVGKRCLAHHRKKLRLLLQHLQKRLLSDVKRFAELSEMEALFRRASLGF